MNYTISLVGYENVGKSTIFNNLTKGNSLVVKKIKGITRDRQIRDVFFKNYFFSLIDTPSFFSSNKNLKNEISFQINFSIQKSNLIFFVVNAKNGLTYKDKIIIKYLRKNQKKTILIINKIDKVKNLDLINDFYFLGLKKIYKISALNLNDISFLKKEIIFYLKKKKLIQKKIFLESQTFENSKKKSIKVIVVGKPNVGKSTLINRLIKDSNRIITSNFSGTTGDIVKVSTIYNDQKFIFFDTVGMRRKSKINSILEKTFIKRSIKKFKKINLFIFIIDSTELDICHQNFVLWNLILKFGFPVIVLVNKWDVLKKTEKKLFKKNILFRFRFVKYIKFHFLSFLFQKNIRNFLLKLIKKVYFFSKKKISSSFLTKILYQALENQKPQFIKYNTRPKLKYAHSGGINPPTIIIHGNNLHNLSFAYKKYLLNYFSVKLNLFGSFIRLDFKNSKNPFI